MAKLFSRKKTVDNPDLPAPHTTPYPDDEELRNAYRLAGKSGFKATVQLMELISTTANAERRHELTLAASKGHVDTYGTGTAGMLRLWLKENPRSAAGWTLLGAIDSGRAGQTRGAWRASETKQKKLEAFAQMQTEAETPLWHAVELDPADPNPWVFLISCVLGRGGSPQQIAETVTERWREATARAPGHLGGDLRAYTALLPKWGSPPEVVESFVDYHRQSAVNGSAQNLIVLWRHVEYVCWELDTNELGSHSETVANYLHRPEVQADARAAIARWWHPDGVDPRRRLLGHNLAAFWYSFSGDHAQAWPHFEATCGSYLDGPWEAAWGDGAAIYDHYRRLAYRAVGGSM